MQSLAECLINFVPLPWVIFAHFLRNSLFQGVRGNFYFLSLRYEMFITLSINRLHFWDYFTTVPILSSLGVLGTFWGITVGLNGFDTDTNALNKSIPILLSGLKTAFYTSLVGMLTSLITNFIINKIYDSYECNLPNNKDEATSRICASIEHLSVEILNNAQNQTVFFNSWKIRLDLTPLAMSCWPLLPIYDWPLK